MIDEHTAQFLELVNCDASEVRDIPADRIGVDPLYIPLERAEKAEGTFTLWFGKHAGKRLNDVPRDYLEWLVQQPPANNNRLEKVKGRIRSFLNGMTPKKRYRAYNKRNARLRRMGFSSYPAYLASDAWREIRQRVLERDNQKCTVCGQPATEAHHKNYNPKTISGANIEAIVALCRSCHKSIEIERGGQKRPMKFVKKALRDRHVERQRPRTGE